MEIKLRFIGRILFISLLNIIIMYIIFSHFPLSSITFPLNAKSLSAIGPKDRVVTEEISGYQMQKIVDDITYFTTNVTDFDNATVKITYKNNNPYQELHIGYKDKKEYHYFTKPIDLPLLNDSDWFVTGDNKTFLYEKNKHYDTIRRFYSDPPQDVTVGKYYSDNTLSAESILVDYKPSDTLTTIDTPLRGSHTFFAYLKNEPFILKIRKQDLNWYDGSDKLTVKIYKNGELLTERVVEDDGITDNSKRILPPQPMIIQYDGNDYPEPGVYKIVLDTSGDVVIKTIQTNLNKLVFSSPIFPINNSTIYSDQLTTKYPLELYTDSPELHISTYHNQSFQDVLINNDPVTINETGTDYIKELTEPLSDIKAAYGDMIISGLGFFAFTKNEYFQPQPYFIKNIKTKEDLSSVDYILTNYKKPVIDDGWKTSEITFDLKNSYYDKGKLSWIIKAPGLKAQSGEIYIKSIEVTMHKDPIIKL